jgi:hypothetical protein
MAGSKSFFTLYWMEMKEAEMSMVPGNIVFPQSSWCIEMMPNVVHKGRCLCGRIFPNLVDAHERTSSAMLHRSSQRALQQLAILPIATATIVTVTLGGGAGHGQWEVLGSMYDKESSLSSQ